MLTANKLEIAVGLEAVEDIATPPSARFAKGVDHIEFARFLHSYANNDGTVMHVRKRNSLGNRIDICLFGSMDNFAGYIQKAEYNPAGWTSSAWYAIEELLQTHGKQNTSLWDDDESRAVEALKVALGQGVTGDISKHNNRPWTRGFTIGCSDETEWFADIYVDVELTKDRWDFDPDDPEFGTERILIGSPVWIRTPSRTPITLYHDRTALRRQHRDRKKQ